MASRGAWRPLTEQGVQWDPQGRPYYNTSDGRRDYIPPVVAAQFRDDPRMLAWAKAQGATLADSPQGITVGTSVPGGGYLHGRGQWDSEQGKYVQPINGGNLLATGIGAAIGAPFLASALGGGGAAATTSNAAGPAVTSGGGATGLLPATSVSGYTTAPSVVAGGIPAALGTASAAGTLADVATGNAAIDKVIDAAGGPSSSIGKKILDAVTSPGGIAALTGGIASLLSGQGSGGSDATKNALASAERMNAITEARMRRVDPLHEAVTQLAFGRLPVSSRNGIAMTRIPLPPSGGG